MKKINFFDNKGIIVAACCLFTIFLIPSSIAYGIDPPQGNWDLIQALNPTSSSHSTLKVGYSKSFRQVSNR